MTLMLGSAKYALGPGKSATLTVKLSAAARAALASSPSHKLRATVTITPGAGPKSTAHLMLVGAKPTK